MKRKAFSLIEFLVVIVIIAIVAMLLIPVFQATRRGAHMQAMELSPITKETDIGYLQVRTIEHDGHSYVVFVNYQNAPAVLHSPNCQRKRKAEHE